MPDLLEEKFGLSLVLQRREAFRMINNSLTESQKNHPVNEWRQCLKWLAVKQGALLFPIIDFFIKADKRGWSFL